MDLKGKTIRITYNTHNGQRYLRGRVIEEDDLFVTIAGLRDAKVFLIAKSAILEITAIKGDRW